MKFILYVKLVKLHGVLSIEKFALLNPHPSGATVVSIRVGSQKLSFVLELRIQSEIGNFRNLTHFDF
jgi:hypothetical protein